MFNLDNFIADSVTKRPVSMFAADIEANKDFPTPFDIHVNLYKQTK